MIYMLRLIQKYWLSADYTQLSLNNMHGFQQDNWIHLQDFIV